MSETKEFLKQEKLELKCTAKTTHNQLCLTSDTDRKKDRDGGLKLIPIFYTIGQLKILTKQSKKTFVIKFSLAGRKNNDRQLHTIR